MSSRLDDLAIAQDAVLVRSHWAGDPSAFAALYSRHYPRVLRTVRRRVHDRTEAEDLAQETFTQALAGLGQLRRPERFYPWLAAIARHMVARHHRVSARLCVIADVDTGRLSDAPESELLRRVDADNLHAALNRVRVRHREILSLREDEGLSYEEIAARLGTPASTIPPLLFRARQALRREYLAITEPRLALWPLALLAVRRARMRLLHGTNGLPTAAASSTVTVAFVAASVGAILLPLNPAPSPVVGMPPSAFAAAASVQGERAATVQASGIGNGDPSVRRHATAAKAETATGLPAVTPYQPQVTWGPDERRHRREHGRHMPYSSDVGPAWIGIDPDQMHRDLDSTLSGDYSWLED